MNCCVLLNQYSGHAEGIQGKLAELARANRCELLAPKSVDEASDQVRDAQRRGCQRVVVAGGDGAVSHLINTLGPDLGHLELGIIPAGTGNDLARSLGLPLNDIEYAWRIAVEGPCRNLDVGQATGGRSTVLFLNAVAGGFGGKVAVDVAPRDKRRWGAFAYWLTAISLLGELRSYEVEIELDHETIRLETYGLGISNGRYVGGGFPIAPHALLDDGLLDVTTVPVLPSMELLAAGLNFTLNPDEREQRVEVHRSRRVRVHSEPDLPFSIDGEPSRAMDAVFEVLPSLLAVAYNPQTDPLELAFHHQPE